MNIMENSKDKNKKSNRDIKRRNLANEAVKGCIYSQINAKCLKLLSQPERCDGIQSNLSPSQQSTVLDIAKKSGLYSIDYLLNSQSSISKTDCIQYSNIQFNGMNAMMKFNETVKSVNYISTSVVDNDIESMIKDLFEVEHQSGKCL